MTEPQASALGGWRESLASALETTPASTPLGGRWAALATVRGSGNDARVSGRPAARTVNLRGLDAGALRNTDVPDAALFRFLTDTRSPKVDDLQDDPHAEVLLFLHPAMLQVRVSGTVQICGGAKAGPYDQGDAQEWWDGLEPFERRYFAWPPPGATRENPLGSEADKDAYPPHGPDERPNCFVMCALVPDHVDVVNLKVFPPVRSMYWRESVSGAAWKCEEVNP